MSGEQNKERFPEQEGSEKIHGVQRPDNDATHAVTKDNPGNRNQENNSDVRTRGQEKYLGEIANIEDVPSDDDREPVEERSQPGKD